MNMRQSKRLISEAQPNAVMRADCVEVMRCFRGCSVDFVLTNPPYLVHYCSRAHDHIRLIIRPNHDTANPGSHIYILEPLW
jgi:hypothetical protein